MAVKIMVFVDGSWMFHNKRHVIEQFNAENFDIDYKKIPQIIQKHLAKHLAAETDVIRTYYFGAIPVNKPGFDSKKQQSFYRYLSEECFFDTEIYDIDFHNDPSSRPKEKCVDIALATSMLFLASIPNVYDVAALVAGDLDYLPMIRRVRTMGKRTQLVGLKNIGDYYPTSRKLLETPPEYPPLFDFPTIFLDDHLAEIRLERRQQIRECMICHKKEFTTWEGDDFYCSKCRSTKRTRICDTCGKQEETTWSKSYFYCSDCRDEYRRSKDNNNSY